jgi:recombination DNA repair RAD52 pathway protein
MPADDLGIINPPDADQANSSVSNFWKHNAKRISLAANKRAIFCVPYRSNYQPIVLNLSNTTEVIVETTVCPNNILTASVGNPGNPQPTWISETVAAKIVINHACVALRITAKSDTALIVDILS